VGVIVGVLVGDLLMLHLSDLADSLGLKKSFRITSSHTQLLRLNRLELASVHRDRQITGGHVHIVSMARKLLCLAAAQEFVFVSDSCCGMSFCPHAERLHR
jgi:hypothetical protein